MTLKVVIHTSFIQSDSHTAVVVVFHKSGHICRDGGDSPTFFSQQHASEYN